jgi:hypothetical protein
MRHENYAFLRRRGRFCSIPRLKKNVALDVEKITIQTDALLLRMLLDEDSFLATTV